MLTFSQYLAEGKMVIFAQKDTRPSWKETPEYIRKYKTHAVRFRGKIFVGHVHMDAIAEIIDHYGGIDPARRRNIKAEIDKLDLADFGYYYDGDFHTEPKPGTGMSF